jgi:hypothetical protein
VWNEKKGSTDIKANADKNSEYSPKSGFDNCIEISLVIASVMSISIKKPPIT